MVDFKERSTKESVCEFLRQIRKANPNRKILIVLDNFGSHHAKKTRSVAKELNITLVFLPPYSPDLNPIEYIWKSIKRKLSPQLINTEEELKTKV
ncbi:IS630 family transposase, partial [archaeon SCG-AAA382B04]